MGMKTRDLHRNNKSKRKTKTKPETSLARPIKPSAANTHLATYLLDMVF